VEGVEDIQFRGLLDQDEGVWRCYTNYFCSKSI